MSKASLKESGPTFNQNKELFREALELAQTCKANALLVYGDAFEYADVVEDDLLPDKPPKHLKIFFVFKKRQENNNTGESEEPVAQVERPYQVLTVPKLKLGRLGILKVALLIGLSSGDLEADDKIVFLGGKAGRQLLDTIMVIDLASETELITQSGIGTLSETVKPDIFEGVLKLAMELANSSREGKSIGTIFVLGDEDKVMQLSKQMIMNPFYGYPSQERQILNPQLKETIREFSGLDGAFIISDEGEVIAAGRYLGASTEETDVLRGLGSRHLAAAGITALTKAVAIVISQSSGDIRIFKNGKTVMEIERQL